jgi:hypothetical protein
LGLAGGSTGHCPIVVHDSPKPPNRQLIPLTPSVVSSSPNGSLKRKIGHLSQQDARSLDHLIGKREQCRRHVETQDARGLLVGHTREVSRLQHPQICRILAA